MSYIGKNIKKIRTVKKMSQAEFANTFDLARPSVGAYEEGRSEPKIDTLISIAKHFQLSVDTLLTKELTINELFKFDIFKQELTRDNLSRTYGDKDEVKEQTPLVLLDQSLEYLVNFNNKDFINSLPVIQFPFTQTKKSRAFQVAGSEMEYENWGLHHKDIIFCKPSEIAELIKEELYVVVTKSEIMVRRFDSEGSDGFIFKTDNPAYDPVTIGKRSIKEIWKAQAVFSNNLKSPTHLESRVRDIEKKLEEVLNKLKK